MKHNWEYKRLGDICDLYQPKTIAASELVEDGEYDVYGANGIIGKFTRYNHEFPEILLTCRGATCGTINISNPKSWINGNAMVIHSKSSELLFAYLKYAMTALDYSNIITGAAQPQITRQSLAPTNIPLPPMEVQEQIVAELDKINETIEDCRELLRNLDALAQSLFYDTFGNPITNPKGWEVKKLSDECLDVVDGDHSAPPKTDKGVPFITISNIDKTRNSIDFSDTFFVPQSYYDGLKDNRKARNGDVLYTVTGSYGVTVLIENLPKFCFQRHIGLIRPKATLNSVFLSYWGRSASIKAYADTVATGIAQKTVSLKSLRDFPIILPPLSLQEQFAARIEQIEAQKKAVEQTIAELQTLLDSRMDYWFN